MFKVKKKFIIYAAVLCALLIFLASSVPTLRAPFLDILKYPLKLFVFIRREASAIIFYHRNFTQNERLRGEIDLLRNKLNHLQEVSLQNSRLKNLLSLKEKSTYKLIAARVIANAADSWSSCVIIDKGRHSGIKRGMAVISYLGLIGRTIEVSEFTSKVLLITDPNFAVSCLVQRSRQEGLVSGTLGAHLAMKYLPKEADINIDDVIITSGLNDNYPKGLLVGTVVDIGFDNSRLSRYCLIKPAVNLASIEEVLVIVQ